MPTFFGGGGRLLRHIVYAVKYCNIGQWWVYFLQLDCIQGMFLELCLCYCERLSCFFFPLLLLLLLLFCFCLFTFFHSVCWEDRVRTWYKALVFYQRCFISGQKLAPGNKANLKLIFEFWEQRELLESMKWALLALSLATFTILLFKLSFSGTSFLIMCRGGLPYCYWFHAFVSPAYPSNYSLHFAGNGSNGFADYVEFSTNFVANSSEDFSLLVWIKTEQSGCPCGRRIDTIFSNKLAGKGTHFSFLFFWHICLFLYKSSKSAFQMMLEVKHRKGMNFCRNWCLRILITQKLLQADPKKKNWSWGWKRIYW